MALQHLSVKLCSDWVLQYCKGSRLMDQLAPGEACDRGLCLSDIIAANKLRKRPAGRPRVGPPGYCGAAGPAFSMMKSLLGRLTYGGSYTACLVQLIALCLSFVSLVVCCAATWYAPCLTLCMHPSLHKQACCCSTSSANTRAYTTLPSATFAWGVASPAHRSSRDSSSWTPPA